MTVSVNLSLNQIKALSVTLEGAKYPDCRVLENIIMDAHAAVMDSPAPDKETLAFKLGYVADMLNGGDPTGSGIETINLLCEDLRRFFPVKAVQS